MPNPDHPYHDLKALCRRYGVVLVVVSKTRSERQIKALYGMGQRIFAENRAHELIVKASLLPSDIEWHLIGHVQRNKVKSVIPYVQCIQSLDSWNLWMKLQDEAKERDKLVRCLLQIKIAVEETKYGWDFEQLDQTLKSGLYKGLPNIIIEGVMGMASLTSDQEQVRKEMKRLKSYFEHLKLTYFSESEDFKVISMGMSGDYKIAIEEGSTMIRIGSLLFG